MPLDNLVHAQSPRGALRHRQGRRPRCLSPVLPSGVLTLADARVGHDVHALVPHLRRAGRDLQALRCVRIALEINEYFIEFFLSGVFSGGGDSRQDTDKQTGRQACKSAARETRGHRRKRDGRWWMVDGVGSDGS